MARDLFGVEKGLRLFKENTDHGAGNTIDHIFGAGNPIGTSGETDAAKVGSVYGNTTDGSQWKKIADTSSASDWAELGNVNLSNIKWRNELVRASTNDTLAAGNTDPTSWSDNEQGLDHTGFAIGEYVLGDVDSGSPVLYEVTALPGAPSITLALAGQVIANNDTFVVQNHLPDSPAAQEAQAILHFPSASAAAIKLADFNWELATGINISGGYTAGSGNVTSSDTVESAIEKLDGVNDAQDSALGLSQGDTSFGAFASPASLLLAASQTAKQLFQRLGDLMAQLRGVTVSGITAITTVDSVPVASVYAVKWLVVAHEEATPANKKSFEVFALNDGTISNVDDTNYARLKVGANFNVDITVDASGSDMRLRATSSTAGITVTARRIEVVKSVL